MARIGSRAGRRRERSWWQVRQSRVKAGFTSRAPKRVRRAEGHVPRLPNHEPIFLSYPAAKAGSDGCRFELRSQYSLDDVAHQTEPALGFAQLRRGLHDMVQTRMNIGHEAFDLSHRFVRDGQQDFVLPAMAGHFAHSRLGRLVTASRCPAHRQAWAR